MDVTTKKLHSELELIHTYLQPCSTAKLYKQAQCQMWEVHNLLPAPEVWCWMMARKVLGVTVKFQICVRICQNCRNSWAMAKKQNQTKKTCLWGHTDLWAPNQLMFESKYMFMADFQKFPRSVLGISCFHGWIVETGSSRTKPCSHGYHRGRGIKNTCTSTKHMTTFESV